MSETSENGEEMALQAKNPDNSLLKIRLLKTSHYGSAEAEKLAPHIEWCDIYSPECSFISESRAIEKANAWAAALKLTKRLINPSAGSYAEIEQSYLFNAKKPVVYVERWPNEDVARYTKMVNEINEALRLAKEELKNEQPESFDEFFRLMSRFIALIRDVTEARDRNIASRLSNIAKTIINENPSFGSKNQIRLTMQIGWVHRIEKYTSMPIEIVNLYDSDPADILLAEMIHNTRAGNPPSKRDMLAYGLGRLDKITPNMVQSATIEELISYCYDVS